jgi:hypothetical protein
MKEELAIIEDKFRWAHRLLSELECEDERIYDAKDKEYSK